MGTIGIRINLKYEFALNVNHLIGILNEHAEMAKLTQPVWDKDFDEETP